ncbi:MAG: calcineurin phosphoesterase [Lysobacteraceae bacterium]|nr:MAG: calcineurin phosphoesterase [Xanthomonadaceae bacterium]
MSRLLAAVLLSMAAAPALALPPPCNAGMVWADRNGNGAIEAGEAPLAGVKVSDGVTLVTTGADGAYVLPVEDGRTTFVIKPAGYDLPRRPDGLPDFWTHLRTRPGPALKYGGIPAAFPGCRNFGLVPRTPTERQDPVLDVLVFSDPQAKNLVDVDYYRRDIVEPLVGKRSARLGITLGDVADDDLSLYPALNQATALLQVPWLHVAGNHDLDFDAARDEDSLLTFRNSYGPDTFAWEEEQAVFVGLDDVVYQPGQTPAYVGGLREDQFAFLEAYLPTVPKDRLLVLGVHIPLFDAKPGVETFRHADRTRLFGLLREFPHVLLLSGHSHGQRHVYHDARSGWQGANPLHEFNVGAACGAFWSGARDGSGIPDSTMSDGTPNGYASLSVRPGGAYALAWHPARDPLRAMSLHAPRVLRQGAYPAWGVYANVFMGQEDTRVEYRVDGGEWKPMKRVVQPDPGLLAENARDDEAAALRGYDRSPEATPSTHLWRGTLPTGLTAGEHLVEVQAWDREGLSQRAATRYRLQSAMP